MTARGIVRARRDQRRRDKTPLCCISEAGVHAPLVPARNTRCALRHRARQHPARVHHQVHAPREQRDTPGTHGKGYSIHRGSHRAPVAQPVAKLDGPSSARSAPRMSPLIDFSVIAMVWTYSSAIFRSLLRWILLGGGSPYSTYSSPVSPFSSDLDPQSISCPTPFHL